MAAESRVDRRGLELWLRAVLFLGLFLYVWQGIQSHLLYYGFGVFTAYPVFSWESSFLRTRFSTPGGPLAALAALLAQTYRSPSLGALVIVAVTGMLFLGTQRLLRSMGAGKLRDLAWVPPILALMIYGRYDNPLPVLLAMGLSIWVAILYGSVAIKTLPVRLGVFLVLFALTYYLAGALALVLACLVCLTEALLHRRISAAIAQAMLAGWRSFCPGPAGLRSRTSGDLHDRHTLGFGRRLWVFHPVESADGGSVCLCCGPDSGGIPGRDTNHTGGKDTAWPPGQKRSTREIRQAGQSMDNRRASAAGCAYARGDRDGRVVPGAFPQSHP